MLESTRDPLLLTPGPLTTAESTKRAMLHDWGSRDTAFIAMTARVRRRLAEIAGGGDVVAVPLQGSGTFAVEATLGTFVPREGKALVLVNGAYGARMARLLLRLSQKRGDKPCQLFAREDIGAMLGITTETASRIIAEFRRSGAIQDAGGDAVRCDVRTLESLAAD